MNAPTPIAFRLFHKTVPALKGYIERIGAKEKNFRRYMVQEDFGHYYKEKDVIKLARDGTIECRDEANAPTEAERAAILLAFANGVEMPRSIDFRPQQLEELIPLMRTAQETAGGSPTAEPIFYQLRDQRTGMIIMVQQRFETPDGKKYKPWAHFSDGFFRMMEVDGDLPFWKPDVATDKPLMVHEGAKAAEFVTAMCADPNSKHPWIDELRKYEHWGMIGGALSPHRADYTELEARKPDLMVYVCDNDQPGKAALAIVSKKYRRTLWGVQFDQTWPPHWDMADPMPEKFFSDAGRYIGPAIDDLVRHATYATDLIQPPAGSKARPTSVITPQCAQEWVQVRKPEVFVNVYRPDKLLSEKEFNGWIRPFSDVDDTARVMKRVQHNKAAGLLYDLTRPGGLITEERDNAYVNTYVAPRLVAEAGDCTPWTDYLDYTFPVPEDRRELVRWVSTLVCHPEIKMNYGVLLISETQGIGKSTLGSSILKPMLGEWNCCEPSEKMVVESNFNSWQSHKRLAIVHEIYAGHDAKAYDKLKSVITEKTLTVNEKYLATYDIANWLHVLACSNSKRALKLSMDDRRWLVPAVTENKRDPAEWKRLHHWLDNEGGHAKIKHWMMQWLAANGGPVERGVDAPITRMKKEVIVEGYGPGQQLVAQTLSILKETYPGKKLIVTDAALQMKIIADIHSNRRPDKLESLATIRKTAKSEEWFVVKQRVQIKQWREPTAVTTALTTHHELVELPIEELFAMANASDVDVVFVDVKRVM